MTRMPATLCLMNETITTAQGNNDVLIPKTVVQGLARAKSIGFQCNFTYGSGGTSATVLIQTSLDGGNSWVDVINFNHATASLNRYANVTSTTGVVTDYYVLTNGGLGFDTAVDGLLGDQWRVLFYSVGTYANTTLQVFATARD